MGGEYLVLAYVATIFVILAAFLYLRRKRAAPEGGRAVEQGAQPNQNQAPVRPRARDRLQRARPQANVQEVGLEGEDEGDEDHESDVDEDEVDANGNLTKAAAKRLRKLEQRRKNEEHKAAQVGKAAKEAARDAKRKEKEESREAAEKAAAEAAAARKEAKDQKEKSEFDQWKTMMSTETAGMDAAEENINEEGLLSEFIAYIKQHKVVVIEDIASEFKLRSTDAVARIKSLEESGAITGVMDDRGKFIYLTQAELDSVANWIKDKGRMTIQEIVAECNRLIDLTPALEPN